MNGSILRKPDAWLYKGRGQSDFGLTGVLPEWVDPNSLEWEVHPLYRDALDSTPDQTINSDRGVAAGIAVLAGLVDSADAPEGPFTKDQRELIKVVEKLVEKVAHHFAATEEIKVTDSESDAAFIGKVCQPERLGVENRHSMGTVKTKMGSTYRIFYQESSEYNGWVLVTDTATWHILEPYPWPPILGQSVALVSRVSGDDKMVEPMVHSAKGIVSRTEWRTL